MSNEMEQICEFEKYVTTSNFVVLRSLDKSHLNSICT